MLIRDAAEADLPGILAIYNDVIAHSTATFTDRQVTLEERLGWYRTRTNQGYPVLVAGAHGEVLGFATFGDFRSWPGYRFTVEHTVHVSAGARGKGVGRALMAPLIARAAALGKHVMIGAIDADNAGSLAFHERLGFERTGHLREVGHKFGRHLDLVFMQKMVG